MTRTLDPKSIQDSLVGEIRKHLAHHGHEAKRKGIKSQAGLARFLKVNESTVTLMLQGERGIKATELFLIFEYLGKPLPRLSDLDGSKKKKAR